MPGITLVGLDADDTLWQNEQFYKLTQERFAAILKDHADPEHLSRNLFAAQKRNMGLYGFGIKGFTLSMIETAMELTGEKAAGPVVNAILEIGRDMLSHPVEILPGVENTLEALAGRYTLVLITKGDLFDQERKLAASGLGGFFDAVEIVSDKSSALYRRIFDRHGDDPQSCLMAGNSLKSDVLPALDAGGWGIYVPHDLTWAMEHADKPDAHPRFREIPNIAELGALVEQLN